MFCTFFLQGETQILALLSFRYPPPPLSAVKELYYPLKIKRLPLKVSTTLDIRQCLFPRKEDGRGHNFRGP